MQCECVVIGAGVVGLAIARLLALSGREVIVIDRGPMIGSETSSRNSEVIHAGLYYPQGSLKAQLCVEGKAMLYDYCRTHHIAHRQCGKLIVASDAHQLADLEGIAAKAAANGVDDLVSLSEAEVCALEPDLACVGALLSPSTGIIDSHGLMLSLQGEAEAHGCMFSLMTAVTAISVCDGGGYRIETASADASQAFSLTCDVLINAAGLGAVGLAQGMAGMPQEKVPSAWLAKGTYFQLGTQAPFSHLIYPVPEPGGLGVHLTLDLAGQGKFGPDVEWVETPDYTVDPGRAAVFYDAVRRYWPGLPDGALQPAYAGLRPKIVGPGAPAADFCMLREADHGLPGLVHLMGIESPGLTSSLALAEHAVAYL